MSMSKSLDAGLVQEAALKQEVKFAGTADFFEWPTGDKVASVYALDHPRLGRGTVRTSAVLKINEDGSFETLNTIYTPEGRGQING